MIKFRLFQSIPFAASRPEAIELAKQLLAGSSDDGLLPDEASFQPMIVRCECGNDVPGYELSGEISNNGVAVNWVVLTGVCGACAARDGSSLTRVPAAIRGRAEAALKTAVEAFFNSLAASFPEAKSGDIDLKPLIRFEIAAAAAAENWLLANYPNK